MVLSSESNLFDQRKLEFILWKEHGIRCIRKSLAQVGAAGVFSAESGTFSMPSSEGVLQEVAVAYYRSGYMPQHYPSEESWSARLKIERSRAIKCPTVGYQLAGSKKVQQDLAMPGVLDRFFPPSDPSSAGAIASLRASFAQLFPLDSSELSSAAVKAALAHPEDFVLKPQREGGGNNLYRQELSDKLSSASPTELSAYILMSRIVPPVYQMALVRDSKVDITPGISELGTYGGFLGTGGHVICNEATGFLLRSKSTAFDDGGVAAGVAYLDSPCLI